MLPSASGKELADFFDWCPASLYLCPTASNSNASRLDPSFYDKLIADNLILRRVRHLPSLPNDIAGTVDHALTTISDRGIKLPPFSAGFPTHSFRSLVEEARPPEVQNEISVANFYSRTTATFCPHVASTLALLPDLPKLSKWLNVLYWTVSPSKSGYADGSLQIIQVSDDVHTETEDLLRKSGLRSLLQQIRTTFGDLAVWVIKSLNHPTMMGIRNEAFTGIPFRWEKMDNDERESVRRQYEPPIGPDAASTPWALPDSDSNKNSDSTGLGQTEMQGEQRPVSPILSSPLSSVPDDDSEIAEEGPVQSSQGEASRAMALQITGSRGRPRGRGRSRGRGRGKSRGQGRGEAQGTSASLSSKKRKRDDDDENYKSKPEPTAASFIQQAWAQAVRHDATLIIIHSGNSEYVCVRHRATQTLYISDLIDVPNCKNPGYAKLHTGIYLTALRDAMDRVMSSNAGGASEDNGNDAGDDGHHGGSNKGKDREPGSGPGFSSHHQTGGGASDAVKVAQVNQKDPDPNKDEGVKQMIAECDRVLMHFQYGIYNSSVLFIRAVARMPRVFQAEKCLALHITSEIGTGAIGIVHGGTLEVELPGQRVSLDVVAKLAFSDHQKERLAHEDRIYHYLRSRHIMGVPTPLGLFSSSSVNGGPSALVMTCSGVCISSITKPLSSNIREQFLVILKEIHNAGIVHGDIRSQNLLIDNRGHASIIDFDQAKKSSSAKDMEKEFLQLVELLNS